MAIRRKRALNMQSTSSFNSNSFSIVDASKTLEIAIPRAAEANQFGSSTLLIGKDLEWMQLEKGGPSAIWLQSRIERRNELTQFITK